MSAVTEKFLRYVAVDTESMDDQDCVPSTEKQKNLSNMLVEELKAMGASNVRTNEHAYVYATIPANVDKQIPSIGFVAHMDTATAMSGKDVKPRIVENYGGGDIVLNEAQNIVMKTADFPFMDEYKGHDLIVTDGTTLLGADDKAGIAEIMVMAEYFLSHPEIPHGNIQIGFTPDEEVGNGVAFFDVEGFGADFAYTVDGGSLGEVEFENFNAAGARVRINGLSIHPGGAKGKMKNALLMGMEFQSMLPTFENPMYTEGYEGFFHLDSMEGGVENAVMNYIIRDHDAEKFEEKKIRFKKTADFLNDKYGEGSFVIELKDSYRNMREMIEPNMFLIDNVKEVMADMGITPIIKPIRGGTDGARLSYMGLPCPNLCTGGENCHGKYEFVSIQSMEKTVELLINMVHKYTR